MFLTQGNKIDSASTSNTLSLVLSTLVFVFLHHAVTISHRPGYCRPCNSSSRPPRHNEAERQDLVVQQFKARVRRDFENFAEKREASGLNARAEARRKATLDKYRRQLKSKRDSTSVLDTSHLYTGTDITVDSDESVVFSDSGTCVLNPEGEVGPFYVKGELIREDVRDDEEGVPVVLEAQFLDVSTCEPIEGVYWDIWNCNSTGVCLASP